jgi:hypothetical protein
MGALNQPGCQRIITKYGPALFKSPYSVAISPLPVGRSPPHGSNAISP